MAAPTRRPARGIEKKSPRRETVSGGLFSQRRVRLLPPGEPERRLNIVAGAEPLRCNGCRDVNGVQHVFLIVIRQALRDLASHTSAEHRARTRHEQRNTRPPHLWP